MKRNRVERIAIILGVSLLALPLFAGVALAAGGAKDQVRDRTKSQLRDGSCKTTAAARRLFRFDLKVNRVFG